MEVGKHIREERERMGLSQEGLAREVFVSRQTVSNWETGKTYPDVQSLLLLSNLFAVTVDSLVKGDVEAMEKNIENYELERFKIKASMGLALSLIAVGGVMQAMLAARGELTTSPLRFIALLMLVAGVAVSRCRRCRPSWTARSPTRSSATAGCPRRCASCCRWRPAQRLRCCS